MFCLKSFYPRQYVGKDPLGSGSCAALPIVLSAKGLMEPKIPEDVSKWKRGAQVRGNAVKPGTVIAVFDTNGD